VIVTMTPNPSVDRTVYVGRLVRGTVVRASRTAVHPSGKGVNVARALAANGAVAEAVLPLGGQEGDQLARLLAEEGISYVPVPICGAIRVNVSVLEEDGTVTKLNEPGPELSEDEATALLDAAIRAASGADWIVGAGSLPRGAPDLYLRLVERSHQAGVPVAIDTRGDLLGGVVAGGADLIKPNLPELAAAVGRWPATVGEAVRAARELADAGARCVLASLGPDGALLVQDGRAWHGEAEVRTVRSTVGAGDALLAGFLAGGGHGPAALEQGLAWAAAACRLTDSQMPTPDGITRDGIRVHSHVDERRPLARRRTVTTTEVREA
jgi:1-phosphofructokinase